MGTSHQDRHREMAIVSMDRDSDQKDVIWNLLSLVLPQTLFEVRVKTPGPFPHSTCQVAEITPRPWPTPRLEKETWKGLPKSLPRVCIRVHSSSPPVAPEARAGQIRVRNTPARKVHELVTLVPVSWEPPLF